MMKNTLAFSLLLLSNLLFAQVRTSVPRSESTSRSIDRTDLSKRTLPENQRVKDILNASSVTCLTDSVYQYTWDTITNNWYLSFISYFGYDSNGHAVIDSFKQWNGVAMANIFADNYYYTGNNMTLSYQYSWNGSAWDYSWKAINTFSGSDLIDQLDQSWNTGGYWENANLQVHTYSGGTEITDTMKYWNGSAWVADYLYNYAYTGADLTNILMRNWAGGSWVNYYQISRGYTGGALTYILDLTWNTPNWDSTFQIFFNYSGGIVTTELFQTRSGATWVNAELDSLFYCAGNTCPSMILQKQWANNTWRNHYKMQYFGCNSISGIKNINVLQEKTIVYPNPANGIVTIESPEELRNVSCTNSLGEIVFEAEPSSAKKQFNLSFLPSAIYFMKVTTGSGSFVKKIILNN